MDPITSIVASSLIRDSQRMSVLGRNMVSSAIPGHRAEIPVMSAFAPLLDVLTTAPPAVTVTSALDTRQGMIRATGRSLDLALEGSGYFGVRIGDAIERTRNGAFGIDAAGLLVDGRGHPIVGFSGEDIVVGSDDVEIRPDGEIHSAEQLLGRIGVFGETGEPSDGDVRMRQGFLEASNVNITEDMVRVMETTRHFGLNARVLKAYDGMLEAAIEQAAEF